MPGDGAVFDRLRSDIRTGRVRGPSFKALVDEHVGDEIGDDAAAVGANETDAALASELPAEDGDRPRQRERARLRRTQCANADHLSASYLVALAGRLVREVGALARRAGASGKRLPTLTIDTEIGFRSAADRAAFADDLTAAVLDLAARYHHDDGRPHRLLVAAHPLPEENP